MRGILKRPHLWPALVSGCLLLVALVCLRFGGEPTGFAETCGAIAIIAFTLTIPVLLAQAYFAALRPIWLKLPETRRTGKTRRNLWVVALLLSVVGNGVNDIIQSRAFVTQKHTWEGNLISGFHWKWDGLEDVDSELAAKIPRGETAWRDLPEEIRSQLGLDVRGPLDAWGSPRMLVAEDRDDGLWLGFYSPGIDRFSCNRGNSIDDISSWSDHWRGFYVERRHGGFLNSGLVSSLGWFLLIFPGVLWIYGQAVRTNGDRQ